MHNVGGLTSDLLDHYGLWTVSAMIVKQCRIASVNALSTMVRRGIERVFRDGQWRFDFIAD